MDADDAERCELLAEVSIPVKLFVGDHVLGQGAVQRCVLRLFLLSCRTRTRRLARGVARGCVALCCSVRAASHAF